MLMTNRRKQVLDKEEIIAAHFGVSLQNSNIFIGGKKFKRKKIPSCIFAKQIDQHTIRSPWEGFELVLV